MRAFDRQLWVTFMVPFLSAVAAFTLILTFSGAMPSLQWLSDPEPGAFALWLVSLLPTYLVQTLPIATVLAVLTSVGRLVQTGELTAARACGIPARRVVLTLVLQGALVSAAALGLQQVVLPALSVTTSNAWWQLNAGRPAVFRLTDDDVFVGTGTLRFTAYETTPGQSTVLKNVTYEHAGDVPLDLYRADRATFQGRTLVLENATRYGLNPDAIDAEGVSARERRDAFLVSVGPVGRVSFETYGTLDDWVAAYSNGSYEDGRSLTELWADGRNPRAGETRREAAWVRFHRKVVESLASLALLATTVPLAVRYGRSGATAIAITLGIALAWFIAIAGGTLLAEAGVTPPGLIHWLTLAVMLAGGTVAAAREAP